MFKVTDVAERLSHPSPCCRGREELGSLSVSQTRSAHVLRTKPQRDPSFPMQQVGGELPDEKRIIGCTAEESPVLAKASGNLLESESEYCTGTLYEAD